MDGDFGSDFDGNSTYKVAPKIKPKTEKFQVIKDEETSEKVIQAFNKIINKNKGKQSIEK